MFFSISEESVFTDYSVVDSLFEVHPMRGVGFVFISCFVMKCFVSFFSIIVLRKNERVLYINCALTVI